MTSVPKSPNRYSPAIDDSYLLLQPDPLSPLEPLVSQTQSSSEFNDHQFVSSESLGATSEELELCKIRHNNRAGEGTLGPIGIRVLEVV